MSVLKIDNLSEVMVVMALESESQGRIEKTISPIYTGVGKVNATFNLTKAIFSREEGYPKLVINIGTAGSHKFNKLALLNCRRFIQHDMDAVAFGYSQYQTPNEGFISLDNGLSITQIDTKVDKAMQEAVLYTGDSFVTNSELNFDAVDMEGYALAKVCYLMKIPFLSVKCVSDGAHDGASISWSETLDLCSQSLSRWLNSFLENILSKVL